MLQLSAAEKYYWYLPPVDMRKGFDALCGIVQSMEREVARGGVFIFCNRKRNQIKLQHWEGDGLASYYKRLEAGRAAIFYNLFATCKLHNVNPYDWLKNTLDKLPTLKPNQLYKLLPQNWVK